MERSTVLRGCGVVVLLGSGAALGASVVLCGGLWAAGDAMNAGPVVVSVGPAWEIDGKVGTAPALAKALETRCVPATNGFRILFAHAWYNAITDGYDARIWMEDKGNYEHFGLYVSGNHVFLRDGVGRDGYVNRVLDCEIDAAELEKIAGG